MSVEILHETEILGRSDSLARRRTDIAQIERGARQQRAEAMSAFIAEVVGDGVLKLGERLKTLAHTIESWRQRRATFGELSALDDRLLADIGVQRSDIPAIAEGSGRRRIAGSPMGTVGSLGRAV
jgi:uncharacterized protein YjiS (DUF1127 family)